ncbi:PspC domain-containing protein [Streptomyces palmae]|uniref:PspC domain-containing protein n=1 Tax=Streptomyces palmae TaxID=1701085 RepID=A0A4Z0GNQ9_9ACTN|nr:PspC domain-containing protein [Streptomyces palmae]TGA98830.1 PspC domain-containing protein [Streptomyces palmae]
MTDAHSVADDLGQGTPPPSGTGDPGTSGGPATGPGGTSTTGSPLRRSREHRMIGGVCAGLGQYCGVDPVVFRVALSVLGPAGGLGLVVYGFCWLLIPQYGEEENEGRRLLSGRVEGSALTAVLCALVGCGLFLSMINRGGVMAFSMMLTLATVGAAYWSLHRRQGAPGMGPAAPATAQSTAAAPAPAKGIDGAPPETQAPPDLSSPSWWRDPIFKDGTTGHLGTGYLWGPDDGTDTPDGTEPRGRGKGRDRRRPMLDDRVSIGGWTFLVAVLAATAGIWGSWHRVPLGTSLEIGLAAALGVFGLGMLISSVWGRTGTGTVLAVLLTGALLGGAAALPKSVTADWKHRTWQPASAAAVHTWYSLGTGEGKLQLASVHPEPGETVRTRAEIGAGRLRVTVPRDVRVKLDIEVGLGDIRLPGDSDDDYDISPLRDRSLTLEPVKGSDTGGRPAYGTLDLRLNVGIGQVEVVRR